MAAITLVCATPMLFMRISQRGAAAPPAERVIEIGSEIWALARTRSGVLAIVIMTLPAALGAAAGLLPAAAGAWHASSDLVALVRGALGGVTTIPGCILGGYLCRHFRHRSIYWFAALVYAGGLAAMALAPHTPFAFGTFMIVNGVILGVAFGAMTTVNYDILGPTSPATVCAGLNSLSNVPLLAATLILGQAEARLGVDGMLLTEAALGAVSVAAYAALASLWRPSTAGVTLATASP
jgi:predicted MFS family arabinose efflux permease